MPQDPENEGTILVLAAPEAQVMRGPGAPAKQVSLDVEQLSVNVNLFLAQVGKIVSKAQQSSVDGFHLAEIEVSAEINGKGQVILWGIGGELGASGALKFVFKKASQ